MRIYLLSLIVMVAFAANSLLARQALTTTDIDPIGFTLVRLSSGAFALWIALLVFRRIGQPQTKRPPHRGSWLSAAALFGYAAAFSFAYVQLSAATGALLLFAAVQGAMLGWAFFNGERLTPTQSLGLVISVVGLVGLLAPGATAPDLMGAALMMFAGLSWAVFTLRGGDGNPVQASAYNFLRSLPFIAVLAALLSNQLAWDTSGVIYGLLSGVVASGGGYLVWYAVLEKIDTTTAATMQLSVPVIAALMGAFILGEPLDARVAGASVAIIGGLGLILWANTQTR